MRASLLLVGAIVLLVALLIWEAVVSAQTRDWTPPAHEGCGATHDLEAHP